MNIFELVTTLETRGVTLHAEGDGLRVKGWAKTATEERELLRARKQELLAFLEVLRGHCPATETEEEAKTGDDIESEDESKPKSENRDESKPTADSEPEPVVYWAPGKRVTSYDVSRYFAGVFDPKHARAPTTQALYERVATWLRKSDEFTTNPNIRRFGP